MKLHFLIIAALLSTPLVSCKTTQAKKGEFKYNGLPFESYDKDGDGFISEIELDERAELAYKMSDINGDQNIDWSEFKTIAMISKVHQNQKNKALRSKMHPDMVKSIDDAFDANLKKRFKELDKNKNKKVSFNEFKTSKSSIKNSILAADTNGDNVVSKEELEINTKLRMMQAITDLQEKLKSSQNQAKK